MKKVTDSYYASRYTYNTDRGIVWKEIVRFLDPFLKGKQTVLDVGAGYCDFINNVTAEKRVAIDMSPDFFQYASDGIQTFQTRADQLSGLQDSSVDAAFSSNLLEHLSDAELESTMKEIKRVLKKGGLFILMQPNYHYSYRNYFDDATHKKVFSDSSLESFLVSYGFNIVKKMPKFLPFSLKSRPGLVPIHPLIIRAYIHSPWKPFAGQMLFVSEKK
jgi:ubiquinone/menaquinone biosynthesis C-methylase UbiE